MLLEMLDLSPKDSAILIAKYRDLLPIMIDQSKPFEKRLDEFALAYLRKRKIIVGVKK
jgi:hypothetical protein